MNRLLLLLFSGAIFFQAQSQLVKKAPSKEELEKMFQENPFRNTPTSLRSDSIIELRDLAMLKAKKPGIYRLPDGMPCIVPDMNASISIPNVWKRSTNVPFTSPSPQIPNLKPKKQEPLRWKPYPIVK